MGSPHTSKKMGRWGLKKLDDFSSTLAAKLGWQLVASDNIWTRVTYLKYITPAHVLEWIRRLARLYSGILIIWKAVLKALDPIHTGITWRIKPGNKVHIGIDPWIGCNNMHRLPDDPLLYLREHQITHLEHIFDDFNTTFLHQAWKSNIQLNISPPWQQHWRKYIQALLEAHIRLTGGDDEII